MVPFPWERALPVSTNYRVLAAMPRAVVAEFPFYGERIAFPLHAQYMVLSTTHWMPLVNGYSDYIPQDFREAAFVLDSFPSTDTFAILQKRRVRYVGIHWDMYGPRAEEIRTKLKAFERISAAARQRRHDDAVRDCRRFRDRSRRSSLTTSTSWPASSSSSSASSSSPGSSSSAAGFFAQPVAFAGVSVDMVRGIVLPSGYRRR